MLRHKILSFMMVSVFASNAAFAETSKQARKNDLAQSYLLEDSGNLFRMVKGNKCQITNNVSSFKVSQHPNDLAMIYFEKAGDLYMLRNAVDRSGKCPKAEKKLLLKSVKKYSIIPSTKSIIVNIALSNSGELRAWSNDKVIVSHQNVSKYKVNPTFGKSGDENTDTIAFIIDSNNDSYTINGKLEAKPEKVLGKALLNIIGTLFNIALDSLNTEPAVKVKPAYDKSTMLENIKSAFSWDQLKVFKREFKAYGKFSVREIKDVLDAFTSYSDSQKLEVLELLVDEGKMPILSGDDVLSILSNFSMTSDKKSALKNMKKRIRSIDGQELLDIIDSMGLYF
ncbi:MAG: hypothetical protein AB8G05_18410 [Oligoflexales bacterium]